MRRIAVVLLLAALVVPAYGMVADDGGASLKELLSDGTYPLTVKLGDLDSEWIRIDAAGQGGMDRYMQMMTAMMGGSTSAGYYTKGETVTIATETYIVAYQPKAEALSPSVFTQGEPPVPQKLTPETPLSLSLLNIRTAGSLTDIRSFDLDAEIAASGIVVEELEGAAEETRSLSNLKQMGIALNMYMQDWDEMLPPMEDAETAKGTLMPYVRNDQIFVHPETGEPYQPNTILSRHKEAHIINPSEMVTFYEASPAEDGTRCAVFLDGHAARIPADEWDLVKRQSKLK